MRTNPSPHVLLYTLAAVLLATAVVLGGCSEDGGDGDTADAGDVSSGDVEEDLQPGQVCKPGTARECIVEGGKQAVICNASGTAWVEGICKGPDGRDSKCVDGSCTACFPGTMKCDGEDKVLRCSDDGSEWELHQECKGGTTGQVCALDLTGNTCESLCSINIKFNSYIGCDYWGVDLDNAFVPGGRGYYDAANAQYAIAVGNPPDSPLPAIVEVWYLEDGVAQKVPKHYGPGQDPAKEDPAEPVPTEPLMPGDLRVFRLPPRNVEGTVQAPLAYRITASVPIFAYQFNPLENEQVFSNDASLLLPATLMGKEYIVMTREQTFDTLRSYLTVVAVLPGTTTVSVDVSGSTLSGAIDSASGETGDIPHMEPGTTKVFKLEQYDVLNIETDRPGEDMTGSRILADKRVAVFGGSEASNAPNTARCIVDEDSVTGGGVCEFDGETSCETLMDCVEAGFNTCCADHLEQQLFPLKTWGTSYVATKSWDRGEESDIWRLMAGADNTKVVLVPPLTTPDGESIKVPVLNKGEWFEFESRKDFEVHSVDGKPILLGQFLAAQDAPDPNVAGTSNTGDAGTGDPAFMLSVPVEQYRRDLVVYTPAEYQDSYLNITTETGAQVTLDGEQIPPGFFEVIGSGDYSVHRTRVEPGPHTISSSEPAGVIVYGYDQYVSYAYTGGLSLEELNKEDPFTGPAVEDE
ncbi:MAG: IgGFc-binding protein [Myxococcota bacterium]